MKTTLVAVRSLFWLVLALLPLAIDREVTSFMVNDGCMPGSQCLSHAMPLIVQIELISLVARVIIWPVAIWHLGGKWLLLKLRGQRPIGEPTSVPSTK